MVSAVVLAAGLSTRMGRNKLLLTFRDKPLVVHAVDTLLASKVGEIIVVLGHERCLVRATECVVDAKWVQIFDFRDGLVRRHREYTDTAAWDAGLHKD